MTLSTVTYSECKPLKVCPECAQYRQVSLVPEGVPKCMKLHTAGLVNNCMSMHFFIHCNSDQHTFPSPVQYLTPMTVFEYIFTLCVRCLVAFKCHSSVLWIHSSFIVKLNKTALILPPVSVCISSILSCFALVYKFRNLY